MRNNLERAKRGTKTVKPDEDDSITTRSVISIISNKGKLQTVNQYRLQKFLGQGSYGQVHLCCDTKTGKKYAMKIMDKKKTSWKFISKNKTVFDTILNEIDVMK